MTVKVKFFTLMILGLILSSSLLNAKGSGKLRKIDNPVEIKVVTTKFDENDRFKVTDSEGNILAYFDRIDDENSYFKAIKIYNLDNEHIFTMSVQDTASTVIAVTRQGEFARIKNEVVYWSSRGKIKFSSGVSISNKDYKLEYNYKLSRRETWGQNVIYMNNKPVITETEKDSFIRIEVDKDYMVNNKDDLNILVLFFQLNTEMLKKYFDDTYNRMKSMDND